MTIKTEKKVYVNLNTAELIEHIIKANEGTLLSSGAIAVDTGKHTARAPKDKFIVKEETSQNNIWWGEYNVPFSEEKFQSLYKKVQKYFSEKDYYLRKCLIGSYPKYALKLHIYTEVAWLNLFAKHMFIETDEDFQTPDFKIYYAPNLKADPQKDGTRSETFIIVNFKEKVAIIGGTAYAGELKKTAFSIMNYLLPLKKVFPMHCSANIGKNNDTAIFFGLSGTGKTTLSSDPERRLIGDDEHGWCEDGIFNFEGGCYAKVINLSAEAEPQIYSAVNSFSAILENVIFDKNRIPDFSNASKTENTRAAYPLNFINNAIKGEIFPSPKNIIMLTYDAFGVLPPIAKLNYSQAMYHFISGYTAKVANTEVGVKEPQATFSACFGAPFMSHHPQVYASMLSEKMKKEKANCWLINTGLCGGPYGVGKRISIKATRQLLNFALSGKLEKADFIKDHVFGFEIPQKVGDIGPEILNPSMSWKNKNDYLAKQKELALMFKKNFEKFQIKDPEILKGSPVF